MGVVFSQEGHTCLAVKGNAVDILQPSRSREGTLDAGGVSVSSTVVVVGQTAVAAQACTSSVQGR